MIFDKTTEELLDIFFKIAIVECIIALQFVIVYFILGLFGFV